MRNAKYIPFFLSHRAFFLSVERERVQAFWGLVWCGAGAAVLPLLSWFLYLFLRVVPCVSFFFPVASSITYLFALCSPYREGVQGAFFFLPVTYLPYLM